jgi:hypothetical protein
MRGFMRCNRVDQNDGSVEVGEKLDSLDMHANAASSDGSKCETGRMGAINDMSFSKMILLEKCTSTTKTTKEG